MTLHNPVWNVKKDAADLLTDVATGGNCDLLAVQGNVNLSALALSVANTSQLDHSKQYTILTCTGARTGTFSSTNLPNNWHMVYQSGGTVKLVYVNGTMIFFR